MFHWMAALPDPQGFHCTWQISVFILCSLVMEYPSEHSTAHCFYFSWRRRNLKIIYSGSVWAKYTGDWFEGFDIDSNQNICGLKSKSLHLACLRWGSDDLAIEHKKLFFFTGSHFCMRIFQAEDLHGSKIQPLTGFYIYTCQLSFSLGLIGFIFRDIFMAATSRQQPNNCLLDKACCHAAYSITRYHKSLLTRELTSTIKCKSADLIEVEKTFLPQFFFLSYFNYSGNKWSIL